MCCLRTGPFFPTRFLDIQNNTVKLANSCDLKTSDGGYTALSYCWVETMPKTGKTTRKTLEARLAGIEFKRLPRTLREAIYVTRCLGIPFIWIDALCIIQGDEADWGKECSMMAQVYSHPVVTIVAAMGSHCDEGFIPMDDMVNRHQKANLKMSRWAYHDSENSKDLQNLKRELRPLHERGWTLQEH
jgi:geranylgeranyl pyrophosphate synthase